MNKTWGKIICLLIVSIDISAGILGIQAETAQNKGKHLRVLFFECKKPAYEAYNLVFAAAGLLALAHAIGTLPGNCAFICSKEELERSSADKQMATLTLILSWIALMVGLALLIIGAVSNSKSRVSCGFEHHNFQLVGGILCFGHGLLCATYYISAAIN